MKFFSVLMLLLVSVLIICGVRLLKLIRLFLMFSVCVFLSVLWFCVLRKLWVCVCSLLVVFLLILLMINSLLILMYVIFLRLVKFLVISSWVKNLFRFSVLINSLVWSLNLVWWCLDFFFLVMMLMLSVVSCDVRCMFWLWWLIVNDSCFFGMIILILLVFLFRIILEILVGCNVFIRKVGVFLF